MEILSRHSYNGTLKHIKSFYFATSSNNSIYVSSDKKPEMGLNERVYTGKCIGSVAKNSKYLECPSLLEKEIFQMLKSSFPELKDANAYSANTKFISHPDPGDIAECYVTAEGQINLVSLLFDH